MLLYYGSTYNLLSIPIVSGCQVIASYSQASRARFAHSACTLVSKWLDTVLEVSM